MEQKEISISTSTILRILGILVAAWLLFLIRDVVVLILFAIVLVSAIEPFVDKMESRKISRIFSVSAIYIFGFLAFGAVLFFLIPPVATQLKQLVVSLPEAMDALSQKFVIFRDVFTRLNVSAGLEDFVLKSSHSFNAEGIIPGIFSTTKSFFGALIAIIIVLAISFYMAVEKGGLKMFINALTPQKYSEHAMRLVKKSQVKLNRWMKGQLVVILIVGLLDYIGLAILNFKFALLLGIMGAIFEIIPYAGPLIAAIFAVLIGLTQSLTVAILAGIWFLIVQQLENHIITPKVMQTTVGLNPVVVILAILVGTKLAGVLGLVLAVPVAAVIEVIVSDFMGQTG
ncbi:MAG: AI-2E family transporter [bacterium]